MIGYEDMRGCCETDMDEYVNSEETYFILKEIWSLQI